MNLCTDAKASSTRALVNLRTAEEIIDVVVREIISEVDRLIFEDEASDVTM